MSNTCHWALRLIHFLYVAFMTIAGWVRRRRRGRPKPFKAQRSKTPKHLCLNLVANNDMPAKEIETAFLQCIQNVATWCRLLGIEALTVYDRHGVLHRCSEDVHRRVFTMNEPPEDSCESDVEYPLTPPHSEPSTSRSHSPEHGSSPTDLNVITMTHMTLRKCRNVAVRRQPKRKGTSLLSSNLTLHIVSRASGKPAIVSASRVLLQNRVSRASMSDNATSGSHLTVSKLAMVLEACLPPPDFMVIHHVGDMKMPYPPIELHGFPPWQNTLTEFHRTNPDDFDPSLSGSLSTSVLLSETAFCRALDEYSGAEFRLGR